MGKRRSSGLFETLVKSVFQTGTTVRRSQDWLGRSTTVVKHYDTGKTKTYTHGTGLFGDVTRSVTKTNHVVTERGKVKKTPFLGTPVERAKRTDGSEETVKRTYGQGLFGDKVRTQIAGPDGQPVGTGTTKPTMLGRTSTTFTRYQTCNTCGAKVGSTDGHYSCGCGRRWGRR